MIKVHQNVPMELDGFYEDGITVTNNSDAQTVSIERVEWMDTNTIMFSIDTLRQLVQQYDDDVKYGEQNKG